MMTEQRDALMTDVGAMGAHRVDTINSDQTPLASTPYSLSAEVVLGGDASLTSPLNDPAQMLQMIKDDTGLILYMPWATS